jgi:hypothetical protein
MVATSFAVAIPSYKRTEIFYARTLQLLRTWGIDMDRVHVFCVAEDAAAYERLRERDMGVYAGMHVVVGPVGLHHMRNFIVRYFPEGTPVLHLDDDLKGLLQMTEDVRVVDPKSSRRWPLSPLAPERALAWVEEAFARTRDAGAHLWGIYPVRNGYFMKDLPEVTTDLRFCVGTCWGMVNDHRVLVEIEEKEDFWRTLLAWEMDGVVLRWNHVCVATSYYTTPGGMQARPADRREQSRTSCDALMARWPQYCRLYTGKKNGMWEVRLRA